MYEFNEAFKDLCRNGKLKLVKHMVKYSVRNTFEWEHRLCSACRGGNLEISEIILERLNTCVLFADTGIYWSYILECAYSSRNLELIMLIIEQVPFWHDLEFLYKNRDFRLINYIIDKGMYTVTQNQRQILKINENCITKKEYTISQAINKVLYRLPQVIIDDITKSLDHTRSIYDEN